MKHIAMISVHGDPSADIGTEGAGGQNVYVREVARSLVNRGLTVDVFTRSLKTEQVRSNALAPGARVIQVPCGPSGYIPRDGLFTLLPGFVRRVIDWARQNGVRYEVVHSNYWISGWAGMRLAAAWRTPQTHTFHSLGKVKYQALESCLTDAGKVRLGVEEAITASVTALIATSDYEAQKLRCLYQAPSHIAVIPCGYDHELFRPLDRAKCRNDLNLPHDMPILLYVGRFVHEKGLETLIRTVSVLRLDRPVYLLLVGGYQEGGADEDEFKRIRSLVNDRGLAPVTRFAGAVRHDDLAAYYSAADVTVIPSHYETFGMVAIEAMASGCPVVASATGGLASNVIHGETGLLATPGSVPEFTQCISVLLSDRYLARKLAILARRHACGAFRWSRIAESLERHYGSLSSVGAI
ncbi:MAG: glycosyltransferase [Cyanobacteria bacterium NC_groundwater_1444_Ag_S-0.65um_54_12]|nr:glycosyltransferase [Cyanobacteria bacterium NC_groundwater_1444_Ag_S-0.65um_54_12]